MHGPDGSLERDRSLERLIGRLLAGGAYASIALVAVGTALLVAGGRSPLEAGPPFDLLRIGPDLVAVEPAGFLWLGIAGFLVTPTARVVAALAGYARQGDLRMVAVAALILVVLAIGVASGVTAG